LVESIKGIEVEITLFECFEILFLFKFDVQLSRSKL